MTTTRARLLEREHGKPLAAVLQEAWVTAPSYRRCAKHLGIAVSTLQAWMRREGLRPSRNPLHPRLIRKPQ